MTAHAPLCVPSPAPPRSDVCIIAPAGAFAPEALLGGLKALENLHFVPPAPYAALQAHRYFAASTDARVGELQRAQGPIVWTARGGSGAAQVVHALPDSFVVPGWLVGFSDITTLHARQQARGICSLHAANVTTLASWTPTAQQELAHIVTGSLRTQQFAGEMLLGGQAEGPLLGGNLTVLASLVGCGILPDFRGSIVLLEDVAEAPYRLERALNQLLLSGTLSHAAGFVLGQMTRCGTDDERGPLGMFAEVLAPLGVPVLAGLPFGHGPSSRGVVLGARARLDAERAQLEVTW